MWQRVWVWLLGVLRGGGRMPRSRTIPERTYHPRGQDPQAQEPSGLYAIELDSIPANADGISIRLTRTAALEALTGRVAKLTLYLKLPTDTQWRESASHWIFGGALFNRVGQRLTTTELRVTRWPSMMINGTKTPVKEAARIELDVLQAFPAAVTLEAL